MIEKQEENNQNNEADKLCRRCGKPIRKSRKGSFTSWIFKGTNCTCKSPSQSKAIDNPIKVVEPLSEDLPNLGKRYKIIELIGKGGMGEVYKAKDTTTGSVFAIKLLSKDLASAPERVSRFEEEIDSTKELDHPNLVAVLDHDKTPEGVPYAVMEYVDGASLAEHLSTNVVFFAPYEAIDIFIQICEGVSYAHARGIVHLDLKPSNVLISKVDNVQIAKVLDFGIARTISDKYEYLAEAEELVGSLPYMSPEHIGGKAIDFRSDIYSLGCLMFEVLIGTVPFESDNPVQIMMKHLDGPDKGFTNQFKQMSIPKDLEQVIRHCLDTNPESRYQCVEEIIRDLESIKEGKKPAIVDSYLQLEKKKQTIFNPVIKRIGLLFSIVLILAYFVFLSQFDTLKQIIFIIYTTIGIGLGLVPLSVVEGLYSYIQPFMGRRLEQLLPGEAWFIFSWHLFRYSMFAIAAWFFGWTIYANLMPFDVGFSRITMPGDAGYYWFGYQQMDLLLYLLVLPFTSIFPLIIGVGIKKKAMKVGDKHLLKGGKVEIEQVRNIDERKI